MTTSRLALARTAPVALQPQAPERIAYEGRVSRVVGINVFVVVPPFSGQREHGPCILIAPTGIPSVGDTVHVLFADTRVPIALVRGLAGWTIGAMEAAYEGLALSDLETLASLAALERGA